MTSNLCIGSIVDRGALALFVKAEGNFGKQPKYTDCYLRWVNRGLAFWGELIQGRVASVETVNEPAFRAALVSAAGDTALQTRVVAAIVAEAPAAIRGQLETALPKMLAYMGDPAYFTDLSVSGFTIGGYRNTRSVALGMPGVTTAQRLVFEGVTPEDIKAFEAILAKTEIEVDGLRFTAWDFRRILGVMGEARDHALAWGIRQAGIGALDADAFVAGSYGLYEEKYHRGDDVVLPHVAMGAHAGKGATSASGANGGQRR